MRLRFQMSLALQRRRAGQFAGTGVRIVVDIRPSIREQLLQRHPGVTDHQNQHALAAPTGARIDHDPGSEPLGRNECTLAGGGRARPSIDPEEFRRFLEYAAGLADGESQSLRSWLEFAEAWQITRALGRCRGNRSATARALGIGRRTLYAKMDKLGITATWGV
jgi:hypothetical protein